ncbi:aspartyl protease family protein [Mucilaginibacter sp. AW1-3]
MIARFKYCAIALMVLVCFNINLTHAQVFEIPKNQKRVTIPFRLLRDMVIVKLKINGRGPYNFILDTGVGVMIITEPKLIDSINIANKRLIKISGLGNNPDFDAYVTTALKVAVDDAVCNDLSAAIFTKDHFGLSNYAGIPIHGLIGYEFFNSFAVKISFEDSTITVGAPKDIRIFKRGDKLPLTIEDHKPYITTRVFLPDGKPADSKLVVDLGAGHPLLLENLVSKNNGLPDKFIPANLGMGLTGPITGYLTRLEEVDLGKYKLKQVITSFPDYVTEPDDTLRVKRDGNIGISILKRFNLIFDYQGGMIYFKPTFLFYRPFDHDMSGLEYFCEGENLKHIVINRVEKGSAADDIGLVKGDEIVRINFKSVAEMSLEEIDNIFRSRADRSILLDVYRDGVYDRLVLTLKKRI